MRTQESHKNSGDWSGRSETWLSIGLVTVIWILHVGGSYLWIRAQENLLLGWDPVGHLIRSLVYYDMLDSFSPAVWFQALALDSFRPPLFHLCTVLMYRIFGVSAQVAVMTTFPFLLLLLLAVYGIGRRVASPMIGVLAAFLVSVFPLVFALTRAFYVDLALTALVSASIYFLMSADAFRSRANSLLFGVTMGLGLLTKWTYPVFVGAPFLYLLVSSIRADRGVREHGIADESVHLSWARLLKASIIAVVLCLIWGLPNWTTISEHPLGIGLLAIWGVLLIVVVYSLLSPSAMWTNLIGSLGIGLLLASFWYAINVDFWKQVYQRSYGGMGGSLLGGRSNAFLYIMGTLDYLPRHLARDVLSWPFVLLLLFAFGKLLYDRVRSRPGAAVANGRSSCVSTKAFWVITLWWTVPLLIFMLSINREERSWLPALPAFALVIALGVARLTSIRVRNLLIAIIVLFGLAQWIMLSCPKFAGMPEALALSQSPIGPIGPLAMTEYIRWPDWKWTDHRYNVADDILQLIEEDAQKHHIARPAAGMLVRISQLRGDVFRYLAQAQGKDIELQDIGETEGGLVTYPRLFLYDYLIVKTGDNSFLNPEAAHVVSTLSLQPPESFQRAFEILAEFPLPDESRLLVYRKANDGIEPGLPEALNPAGQFTNVQFGDKLHLTGYTLSDQVQAGRPFEITLFWQVLEAMDTDYHTSLKLLNASYRVWGESHGLGRGPWALTSSWLPGQVIKDTRQLDIYPGTPPGEYRLEVALTAPYQRKELSPALAEAAFIGPIEVSPGHPDILVLDYQYPSRAVLGEAIRLLGYNLDREVRPGQALPLVLFWQCQAVVAKNYTVFTHLVDETGQLLASKDSQPDDGFYPTTEWTLDEVIRDPYDIPVPLDIRPGSYHLIVGMYDAETGERLTNADNATGHIDLGTVVVSR